MVIKVNYELKVDKAGRKYANKIDLITGKKSKIKYKTAQKRISSLKYQRKRRKIEEKLKEIGAGASYKEYKKTLPIIQEEIKQKYIKKGKKVPKASVIRGQAKKKTIEERTGIGSRYRFGWVYWLNVEYIDEKTGKKFLDCDTTPVFEAGSHWTYGDRYDDMCDVCQEIYDNMMVQDLCRKKISGGACVLLYNKFDKKEIKRFELGEGCGYDLHLIKIEKEY